MAKSMNVIDLFESFDNKKEERANLFKKACGMSEEVEKRKAQIYNQIFAQLPLSPENAKTAKQIVNGLTNDKVIAQRLMSMLTNLAPNWAPRKREIYLERVGYIGTIHNEERRQISYSIACDENGEPIPGAELIKHSRIVKVYWYSK